MLLVVRLPCREFFHPLNGCGIWIPSQHHSLLTVLVDSFRKSDIYDQKYFFLVSLNKLFTKKFKLIRHLQSHRYTHGYVVRAVSMSKTNLVASNFPGLILARAHTYHTTKDPKPGGKKSALTNR